MSQTPSLSETIEAALDERLEKFVTALPARVDWVNYEEGLARVEISIVNLEQVSDGRVFWHQAKISDVPILYPGSGKNRMTYPIAEGDQVLYIVSSLPTWGYMQNKSVREPKGADRLNVPTVVRNNIACGFCIPGLHTNVEDKVPIDKDNIVIEPENKVKLGGKDNTEPTIMANTFWGNGTSGLQALLSGLVTVAEPGGTGALHTLLTNLIASGFKTTKVEVK